MRWSGCNYWANQGKHPEEPAGTSTSMHSCEGCEHGGTCPLQKEDEVWPYDEDHDKRSVEVTFSNLKAWLLGVHHGVAPQHLQAYLNEFTFRFNRRFFPFTSFRSLLGIGSDSKSATYAELYSGDWDHPSFVVED
jgi:hypothetical protein